MSARLGQAAETTRRSGVGVFFSTADRREAVLTGDCNMIDRDDNMTRGLRHGWDLGQCGDEQMLMAVLEV